MNECPALDLQDLLPDFVAERLDPRAVDAVVTHVAACAACQRDVLVLRRVRSVGIEVPVIDPAQMAAAVMARMAAAAPAHEQAARPALRVVDGAVPSRSSPTVTSRSLWRRAKGWQMAAALTLVVSGVLATTRSRPEGPVVASRGEDSVRAVVASASASGGAVSYGDLTDYSEGELETMLATLEGWDGAARTEPASYEPVVVPAGGIR
jgi:hypothetical protein